MNVKDISAVLAALLLGSASLALAQTQDAGTMPPKPGPGGSGQEEQGVQEGTEGKGITDSRPGTGTSGMQDGKPKDVTAPNQTSRPKGVPEIGAPGSGSGTVQDRSGSIRDTGSASDMERDGRKGRMRPKGEMSRVRVQPSKDVRDAQQQLKDAGFDPGPIDGIMGSHTRSALRKFQRDRGMKVTGRLDSETKQALMSGQARSSRDSGSMPDTSRTQPGGPQEEKSSRGATPSPSVPGSSTGSTGGRGGS